ncbi:MAG: dockerin type I repeat-containing protein [Oscillospiraceae bacterium]|nr:dockerin type I repeat-containing protein [Oscillospiraceae bacterium]
MKYVMTATALCAVVLIAAGSVLGAADIRAAESSGTDSWYSSYVDYSSTSSRSTNKRVRYYSGGDYLSSVAQGRWIRLFDYYILAYDQQIGAFEGHFENTEELPFEIECEKRTDRDLAMLNTFLKAKEDSAPGIYEISYLVTKLEDTDGNNLLECDDIETTTESGCTELVNTIRLTWTIKVYEKTDKIEVKDYMKKDQPSVPCYQGETRDLWLNNEILCQGASIAEAEIRMEKDNNLPITFDYTKVISTTTASYRDADSSLSLMGTFTASDDAPLGYHEVRFVVTKLIDENGTDLLQYYSGEGYPTITQSIYIAERKVNPGVDSYSSGLDSYSSEVDSHVEPTEKPTESSTEAPTEKPTEPEPPLGDLDGDTTVNASDAAKVLIDAAAMGAGEASGLTEAPIKAADVNKDDTVNASDAAIILIYSAAVGAGQDNVQITDFVH